MGMIGSHSASPENKSISSTPFSATNQSPIAIYSIEIKAKKISSKKDNLLKAKLLTNRP